LTLQKLNPAFISISRMLESRELHNLARNLSYRTCSSKWRGVTDLRRTDLANTQNDHFMATIDCNGNVRYVYRNPMCQKAGTSLSSETADGARLFYEHAGTPSKLVCIYLPNETRISADRDEKWFHVNSVHAILGEVDGEPFVAPDGKLWLRGRDGVFRVFPLEQTLAAPKVAPKHAEFHPVPAMQLSPTLSLG
jgi:hypothetical protein